MRVADRLRRLEEQSRSAIDLRGLREQAADHVQAELQRLASRFPDEAAAITLEGRIAKMSAAEHFAWGLRFETHPTPLVAVMQMHGVALPSIKKETDHAHR